MSSNSEKSGIRTIIDMFLKKSRLEQIQDDFQKIRGKSLPMKARIQYAIDLAAWMLERAEKKMSFKERSVQKQLFRMMNDPEGKFFTTSLTDQCFRSSSYFRIADQIIFLLKRHGTPRYLGFFKRLGFSIFRLLGPSFAQIFIPFITWSLRKETSRVILPAEPHLLKKHLKKRREEGVRVNLNHLGEAILSEEEALHRLQVYLKDLENPEIDYVSIKISTIFSQIQLLAFDETVDILVERLRELYRASMKYPVGLPNGKTRPKFVNLDMEEYRDLRLTVAAFCKALSCDEFESYSAGIVLQAYLPDSHLVQKELTEWAKKRVQRGGSPIKIRIVKGANLAMEQVEASLRGWKMAPYPCKLDVDANYKKMVLYGCQKENARAVRLGIASHNLFDLAFGMILRLENEVEESVGFEMLEGMADSMRKVVQELSKDILLYCPIALKSEFQYAIAYLIRRLDENTGPENFLRAAFGLKVGSVAWETQKDLFVKSCEHVDSVFAGVRRDQNRQMPFAIGSLSSPFENEPDTDFSLPENQVWAQEIAHLWNQKKWGLIPFVVAGKEFYDNEDGELQNPSQGGKTFIRYARARSNAIDLALDASKTAQKKWQSVPVQERSLILSRIAQKFREKRSDLIGAMMLDGGKIVSEADAEVSEAIDFAEYYAREMLAFSEDVIFKPKGTVLVTPPWNFPCAIAASGILAALVSGNAVLFKPASDTVLVGWVLCQLIWECGVSKEILQFIPCSGEEVGAKLIADPRVDSVILTGGTETAQKFLKMRPDLDLSAETGGKNAIIVTAMADRDLAIKEILHSAFGHAGQKCSACSLLILEKEVYEDAHFIHQLKVAAQSLKVGSPFDLKTKISPLIHPPKGVLKRALTSLEPHESWLLEPRVYRNNLKNREFGKEAPSNLYTERETIAERQGTSECANLEVKPTLPKTDSSSCFGIDSENPCLWSPGIKMNVQPHSFTHVTEFFGPVLSVMKARDLSHAIFLANSVPYGLTSGLFSLDEREQKEWLDGIEAGNLYINRAITGAIVRRQPFGGTKLSSFGRGLKVGGPHYLKEFVHVAQKEMPTKTAPIPDVANRLTPILNRLDLSKEDVSSWFVASSNYAYVWEQWKDPKDESNVLGQDNDLKYVPRKKMVLRIDAVSHNMLDALLACSAALICGVDLEISFDPEHEKRHMFDSFDLCRMIEESQEVFYERVREGAWKTVRCLQKAPLDLYRMALESNTHIADDKVLLSGEFELLHYVREVAISMDYHRYGNLGLRNKNHRDL